MIDDADAGDGSTDGLSFPRSYDSFKHTAGISLLALGGVFAFADGSGMRFPPAQLVIILSFIAIAGITSILMTGMLATLEIKPEPRALMIRRIRMAQLVIGFSLFGGLGGFTFNFLSALLKG